VFKRKVGHDNKVKTHKARLVARGFQQEEGIDYEETFTTVVKASLQAADTIHPDRRKMTKT
jgi:hypothetical protein